MKSSLYCIVLSLILSISLASCECESPAPEGETVERTPPEPRRATADIETFLQSLPDAELPQWDEARAAELVALPLSCIDRLHARSKDQGYLYERTYHLRADYEDSLSFYGCSDWHSAVNSVWTMAKVLKDFPDMWLGKLIREKLRNHLSKGSLEGELAFFKDVARKGFERPYGWAWLLKVYTELISWDDLEAEEWAENLAPLVRLLSERTIEYLDRLSYPMRIGTHGNTAFSLTLILEYARVANDQKLESAVISRATSFFADDVNCPVEYEPSGSDFFSPCLTEAVLMSRILDQKDFTRWFDQFMPPVNADEFRPLTTPIRIEESYLPEPASEDESGAESGNEQESEVEVEANDDPDASLIGARSHLIGLAFYRAAAMNQIAASLPENDYRREAYRKLAAFHGQNGFETMYEADYTGTHWLASYAVYMLTSSTSEMGQ